MHIYVFYRESRKNRATLSSDIVLSTHHLFASSVNDIQTRKRPSDNLLSQKRLLAILTRRNITFWPIWSYLSLYNMIIWGKLQEKGWLSIDTKRETHKVFEENVRWIQFSYYSSEIVSTFFCISFDWCYVYFFMVHTFDSLLVGMLALKCVPKMSQILIDYID